MTDRILPRVTSLSRPFWDGCREGRLRLQRCDDCSRFQFYPRIFCTHCGGSRLDWHTATGRGVIASFTVVRRPVSPAYEAPYIVALVDLDEGPRMMSSIAGAAPEQVQIGAAVEAAFARWSDEIVMPVFTLSSIARGVTP